MTFSLTFTKNDLTSSLQMPHYGCTTQAFSITHSVENSTVIRRVSLIFLFLSHIEKKTINVLNQMTPANINTFERERGVTLSPPYRFSQTTQYHVVFVNKVEHFGSIL